MVPLDYCRFENLGREQVSIMVSRDMVDAMPRDALVNYICSKLLAALLPIVVDLDRPIAIAPRSEHLTMHGTVFTFDIGITADVEIEIFLRPVAPEEKPDLPPGITGDEPMLGGSGK